MRTRIISAFPGTGKSYYHNKYPKTTLDSDSSNFSWIYPKEGKKVRHPDFPNNYIKHIKDNIGKYNYIFVSSHKEVRDALLNECIFFYLIYPRFSDRDFYMKRYEDRGSPEGFINLINNNWHDWIKECKSVIFGCENICMITGSVEAELLNIDCREE